MNKAIYLSLVMGAATTSVWAADAPASAAAAPKAWSAYQPVKEVVTPAVRQKGWVRTPADAFVLSALEAKGLKPSKDADRATFIRRATLDAWGLLPTPEEIKAFVADKSPDAHDKLVDRLLVRFGCEILALVPGRVSTEVDARLSFDTAATVARAQRLIALYRAEGVPVERVLIKVAATWEGIQAAQALERQGIRTNLTLLFAFAQAVACGQAKVQLISPFVGRIYDWYKKSAGAAWDEAAMAGPNDPGVRSVRSIYEFYKKHGIQTEVMGASFRNVGQITALAGCDLLTISPELLAQLTASEAPLSRALDAEAARKMDIPFVTHDEASFRFALNEDAMATEKLAEGIRAFVADTIKLEALMV